VNLEKHPVRVRLGKGSTTTTRGFHPLTVRCSALTGEGPLSGRYIRNLFTTWPRRPSRARELSCKRPAAGWLSIQRLADGTLVFTPAVPGSCVCDCPDGERC
jgi:hypothetical protein